MNLKEVILFNSIHFDEIWEKNIIEWEKLFIKIIRKYFNLEKFASL